jgi:5-methylcytosine-specific restriction protein A
VSNIERKQLYKQKAWYKLRYKQLMKDPLCQMHLALQSVVRATIVDHIKPHRGNEDLFYDPRNLQSLCEACHNRHKQKQERSGHLVGHKADGLPVDPNHHWN